MRSALRVNRSFDSKRRARSALLVAACLALVFAAGTLVAPILAEAGLPGFRFLESVYSPVCHQNPERCLPIGTGVQAVCARCAGLYWGGVLGLFSAVWIVAGRSTALRPVWLACAVVPTVIDALLPWIGLPGLPELPRLLLAIPAGWMAALFLAVGIVDLVTGGAETHTRNQVLGTSGVPGIPETGRGFPSPAMPRALEDVDG